MVEKVEKLTELHQYFGLPLLPILHAIATFASSICSFLIHAFKLFALPPPPQYPPVGSASQDPHDVQMGHSKSIRDLSQSYFSIVLDHYCAEVNQPPSLRLHVLWSKFS